MTNHIKAWHESPASPEFVFWYNHATQDFGTTVVTWIDISQDADREAAGTQEPSRAVAVHALAKRELSRNNDAVCPASPCRWTWSYSPCTLAQLGTTLKQNPPEDIVTYYYYLINDSSAHTPDFEVPMHYRGTNPTASELSAALGSDVFRALCWMESRWRQFDASGKPMCNVNSNESADWGCMQVNSVNDIAPLDIWDYISNIRHAKSIFATAEAAAQRYLDQHPPVTSEMLLNESLQRYNGGRYYAWNEKLHRWDVNPPDGPQGYVSQVRAFILSKPWPHSTNVLDGSMSVEVARLGVLPTSPNDV